MYYKILTVALIACYVFPQHVKVYYEKYVLPYLNILKPYADLCMKYVLPYLLILKNVVLPYLIMLKNFMATYFIALRTQVYKYFVSLARDYLKDVVSDQELNDTINAKLTGQLDRLTSDEELILKLKNMLKKEAHFVANDPEMLAYIHTIILEQLKSSDSSPDTRAAIAKLLQNQMETIVKEPWFEKEIKEQIIKLIVATCESNEVKDKLQELLEGLNEQLIEKGEITKQLNDLLLKIINDPEFLKNAGSGVRKTIRHTFWGMFNSYPTEQAQEERELKDTTKTFDKSTVPEQPFNAPEVIIIKDSNDPLLQKLDGEKPQAEKMKVSITKGRSNSLGGSGIIENPRKEKDKKV